MTAPYQFAGMTKEQRLACILDMIEEDDDEEVTVNDEETYFEEYGGEAVYDPWHDLDLGIPGD